MLYSLLTTLWFSSLLQVLQLHVFTRSIDPNTSSLSLTTIKSSLPSHSSFSCIVNHNSLWLAYILEPLAELTRLKPAPWLNLTLFLLCTFTHVAACWWRNGLPMLNRLALELWPQMLCSSFCCQASLVDSSPSLLPVGLNCVTPPSQFIWRSPDARFLRMWPYLTILLQMSLVNCNQVMRVCPNPTWQISLCKKKNSDTDIYTGRTSGEDEVERSER